MSDEDQMSMGEKNYNETRAKVRLFRPLVFSLIGGGLIWLPVVNDLATGTVLADPNFSLWSSGLATIGIWALIWLNWGLRNRNSRKEIK